MRDGIQAHLGDSVTQGQWCARTKSLGRALRTKELILFNKLLSIMIPLLQICLSCQDRPLSFGQVWAGRRFDATPFRANVSKDSLTSGARGSLDSREQEQREESEGPHDGRIQRSRKPVQRPACPFWQVLIR